MVHPSPYVERRHYSSMPSRLPYRITDMIYLHIETHSTSESSQVQIYVRTGTLKPVCIMTS